MCGSVRVALSVCELAFTERTAELGKLCTLIGESPALVATPSNADAAVPVAPKSTVTAMGAPSLGAGSGSSSPSSSPKGAAARMPSSVLLTVASAKNALNKFLEVEFKEEEDTGGEGTIAS